MTATAELTVLLTGTPCGILRRAEHGRLTFIYDDDYIAEDAATPLSLSLPITDQPYTHHRILRWITSLLPDNSATLSVLYERYNTNTPFGLLSTDLGHDCAGAVQFCRRGEEPVLAERAGGLIPLTDDEVAETVHQVVNNPSGLPDESIEPYCSLLAGYQDKLALQRVEGRWARPYGSVPTTHILKPRGADAASVPVIEHLCAATARRLGLNAVATSVETHAGYPVLVVERFDRTRTSTGWERCHQEDMCQALGLDGQQKYEHRGGPGMAALRDVLAIYSSDPDGDIGHFADALLWALICVNRDAHARNYGLLLTGYEAQMCPLYDLQSSLPYASEKEFGERYLAMRYGTGFTVYNARSDHALRDVAARLCLAPERLLDRAEDLTGRAAAAFDREIANLPEGLQEMPQVAHLRQRLGPRLAEVEQTIAANRQRIQPRRPGQHTPNLGLDT